MYALILGTVVLTTSLRKRPFLHIMYAKASNASPGYDVLKNSLQAYSREDIGLYDCKLWLHVSEFCGGFVLFNYKQKHQSPVCHCSKKHENVPDGVEESLAVVCEEIRSC